MKVKQVPPTEKYFCPFCEGSLPNEHAACCGEIYHAVPGCPDCGDFPELGCQFSSCPNLERGKPWRSLP